MPKYLGTVVYDSDTSTWSVEAGLPGTAVPPVAGDDIVSGTVAVTALLSTRTGDDDDDVREVGDRGRRYDAETGRRLTSTGEPEPEPTDAELARGRKVRTNPPARKVPATDAKADTRK